MHWGLLWCPEHITQSVLLCTLRYPVLLLMAASAAQLLSLRLVTGRLRETSQPAAGRGQQVCSSHASNWASTIVVAVARPDYVRLVLCSVAGSHACLQRQAGSPGAATGSTEGTLNTWVPRCPILLKCKRHVVRGAATCAALMKVSTFALPADCMRSYMLSHCDPILQVSWP